MTDEALVRMLFEEVKLALDGPKLEGMEIKILFAEDEDKAGLSQGVSIMKDNNHCVVKFSSDFVKINWTIFGEDGLPYDEVSFDSEGKVKPEYEEHWVDILQATLQDRAITLLRKLSQAMTGQTISDDIAYAKAIESAEKTVKRLAQK